MVPEINAPWEEWRRWQFGELRKLLDTVWAKSKLYRSRFKEAGARPDDISSWDDFSSKIPVIDKTVIIEDQQKTPPFGSLLATEQSNVKYIFCYAGPEFVVYDEADWDKGITGAVPLALADIRESDVVNITMIFHWMEAGLAQFTAYRKRGAAIIPGGIGEIETQIEVMCRTKATVLVGFPTFVKRIAERAKEMGLDPRTDFSIRLGMLSGEMWSAAQRRELEETYGMDTRQSYGMAELGGVAYECALKNGMHLDPRVVVEVVDPDNGRPVPEGHPGEIVVTSLVRECQPMIRFRTYDITSGLDFAPCACGISSPRLSSIVGRSGDILRVKGMWVVPRQVEEVFSRHPELGRFQAIVDRPGTQDVLTIRVQKKQPCDVPVLTEQLKQELKEKIRLSCEVELVSPEEIPGDARIAIDKRSVNQ